MALSPLFMYNYLTGKTRAYSSGPAREIEPLYDFDRNALKRQPRVNCVDPLLTVYTGGLPFGRLALIS